MAAAGETWVWWKSVFGWRTLLKRLRPQRRFKHRERQIADGELDHVAAFRIHSSPQPGSDRLPELEREFLSTARAPFQRGLLFGPLRVSAGLGAVINAHVEEDGPLRMDHLIVIYPKGVK